MSYHHAVSMMQMTTGTVTASSFRPAPLRPELILSGKPETRTLDIGRSPDGKFSFNLWDCTAGRFRWVFQSDDFIEILEGTVTITPDGGNARTLTVGDVAYFPGGLATVWEVPTYFKKLSVHRKVHVPLSRRVTGKLRRLLTRVTAQKLEGVAGQARFRT